MRRSLAWMFVAVSTIVALAFVVPLGFLVRSTAEDRAIDTARADAAAVVPAIVAAGPRGQLEAAVAATPSGAGGRMTVITGSGLVVGPPIEESERVRDALTSGVSSIGSVGGGKEVVAAVAGSEGELSVVRVFVPDSRLRRGQWAAWGALSLVAIALVGLSVIVADRLALSVVRPTQRLAQAASELGSGDLSVRVRPAGPAEVKELSQAFNELAARVSAMIGNERELVAELSHRLRTPLTALSMRVEQVQDPDVAAALRADVARLAGVVDQLIAEARRRPTRGDTGRCDAAAVVGSRVDFWSVLAQDQERAWRFDRDPGETAVAISEPELVAALDVLIENVFAHTTEGTGMAVWVRHDAGLVRIGVADEGEGFDASLVAAGRSGGDSTGLGLAIARRTAEHAGGGLEVRAGPAGGTVVEIVVPEISPGE